MILRRLLPDDWALFRDIRLEMLHRDPLSFGSRHADWAAKPEAEIRAWLTRLRAFGLLDETVCTSVAAWQPLAGPIAGHRGTVVSAYTRPESRGRAQFATVLAAIEKDATASGVIQLEFDVVAGNTAALAAYRRAGFTICGRKPRAVCHDGVFRDAIALVKRLDRA